MVAILHAEVACFLAPKMTVHCLSCLNSMNPFLSSSTQQITFTAKSDRTRG